MNRDALEGRGGSRGPVTPAGGPTDADDAAPAERARAWMLGTLVMVVWGGSFVATRRAVKEIPPFTLAFVRFSIALVVLLPWVKRAMDGPRPSRADRRDMILAGIVGVTLAFLLENLGLAHTTASHGSLLIAITPLATVMTEAVTLHRLPPRGNLLGFLVALAGVVWIVGRASGGGATPFGDLLLLGSVAVWVAYGRIVHRLTRRHAAARVTNAAILWGVVTLAPLAAGELIASGGMSWPSTTAVTSTLFLALFCSALGYLGWNEALRVLGATATNSLIYGIPVVAVAGGALLLGEPLTPNLLGGGVLVLLGLVLANRRPRAESGPAGDPAPRT